MNTSDIALNVLMVVYTTLGLALVYCITDLFVNWRVLRVIRRNIKALPYCVPVHSLGSDTGRYTAFWEHGMGRVLYTHDHVRIVEYAGDTNVKLYFHPTWLLKHLMTASMRRRLAKMACRDEEEFAHIRDKHAEYTMLRDFYESSTVRGKPKIKRVRH